MAPLDEFSKLLKKIFRDSHLIQEATIRYQQQARELQEISVNAAIAAGHCGDQSKVFSEIAKQISAISVHLSETIGRIQVHTGFTTGQMLEAIILVTRRQKLNMAIELILSESVNLRKVLKVRDMTDTEISEIFEEVVGRLFLICPETEKIRILMNRIWSVITNLKIMANMDDRGDGHFYLSIAESLHSLTEEMGDLSQSMIVTLTEIKDNLETGCLEVRGSQNVA